MAYLATLRFRGLQGKTSNPNPKLKALKGSWLTVGSGVGGPRFLAYLFSEVGTLYIYIYIYI